MFPIRILIVLLVICQTTVCQTENPTLMARFRRQRRSENTKTQTSETSLDELIGQIFKTKNGTGLVLFNTSHNTNERVVNTSEVQQDQSLNEKQDFKVQRNPDGKLNIVFNDVFFSQKTVPQRSTTSVEKKRVPNVPNMFSQKDIYFPDEVDTVPKCKEEGKSFCTEVQNYPAYKLDNALKSQLSKFEHLFGEEDIVQPLNISQRMSPGEESLCNSIEKVVRPQAGQLRDLEWLFIVNHNNYTQSVKIEECVNPESSCMFAENFPNRYVTMCKQSYIYRQLVAVAKNGDIVKNLFKLPSCCKCILKQV